MELTPLRLTGSAYARTAQEILQEEPNSALGNVLRFLSRPLYTVNSLISGDIEGALKNLGQMALDLPTGGFLNRNLSLANLVDDDGDITTREQRPEFTNVLQRWGMISDPKYLNPAARLGLDLAGGIVLDPLTYLGGTGLGKAAVATGLKGAKRAEFVPKIATLLSQTDAGKTVLQRTAARRAEDWLLNLNRANAQTRGALDPVIGQDLVVRLQHIADQAPKVELPWVFRQAGEHGPVRQVPNPDFISEKIEEAVKAEAAAGQRAAGVSPMAKLQNLWAKQQEKAAEEIFWRGVKHQRPDYLDVASETVRGRQAQFVDEGIAALDREGMVLDARHMYWQIPLTGKYGKIPGASNFWSKVGRFGTAPGWAREALARVSPNATEYVDAFFQHNWNWLVHTFSDRTKAMAHLLPDALPSAMKRLGFEDKGLRTQDIRTIQQNADVTPAQAQVTTEVLLEEGEKYLSLSSPEPGIRGIDNLASRIETGPPPTAAIDLVQLAIPNEITPGAPIAERAHAVLQGRAPFAHVNGNLADQIEQAVARQDAAGVAPLRGTAGLADVLAEQARAGNLGVHRFTLPDGRSRALLYQPPTQRGRTHGAPNPRRQRQIDRVVRSIQRLNDPQARRWHQGVMRQQEAAVTSALLPRDPNLSAQAPAMTPSAYRARQRQARAQGLPDPPRPPFTREDENFLIWDEVVGGGGYPLGTQIDFARRPDLLDDYVFAAESLGFGLRPPLNVDQELFFRAVGRRIGSKLGRSDMHDLADAFGRVSRGTSTAIDGQLIRRAGKEMAEQRKVRLGARRANNLAQIRLNDHAVVQKIARRWALLPENRDPMLWQTAETEALGRWGSVVSQTPPGQVVDFGPMTEQRYLRMMQGRPEMNALEGRAARLTADYLKVMRQIPKDLAETGQFHTTLTANPYYVPHQLDPKFAEILRGALGHPERGIERQIRQFFPGFNIRDVYTETRKHRTSAEYVQAWETQLREVLSNEQIDFYRGGATDYADRLIDEILDGIAKRMGLDVSGMGMADTVQQMDILELWRNRIMSHRTTQLRAKMTREAMALMGLKPAIVTQEDPVTGLSRQVKDRVGITTDLPTGPRVQGQQADSYLAQTYGDDQRNAIMSRYLQYQFAGLGMRTGTLQKVLGGGSFRTPIPLGHHYATARDQIANQAGTRRGWFESRIVVDETTGVPMREWDWPGLNFFWKPLVTSIAFPTKGARKTLSGPAFDPGAAAVPIFPAYHVRNTMSALFMMALDPDMRRGGLNGHAANIKAVLGTLHDGFIVRAFGRGIKGDKAQTAADFMKWLGEDAAEAAAARDRLIGSGATFGRYSMEDLLDATSQVLGSRVPLQSRRYSMTRDDLVLGLVRSDMLGREVVTNGPRARVAFNRLVHLGSNMAEYTENRLRIHALTTLLEKGVDMQDAIRRVNRAFVDYNVNSSTEMWLRDVIPFAKWALGSLHWTKDAFDRPKLINWMARVRGGESDESFLPEQAEDSLAIPLPWRDYEGNMQFLTSLGLPMETTLNLIGTPTSARNLRRGVLASMSPFVRTPLEAVTDKSFFFGGEFGDYRRAPRWLSAAGLATEIELPGGHKRWEVPGYVNEMIKTMPTSRLTSMIDNMMDDRVDFVTKLIRNTSGVKIQSVDVKKEFKLRLVDYLKEAAKRGDAGEKLIYFERGFGDDDVPADLRIVLSALKDLEKDERR